MSINMVAQSLPSYKKPPVNEVVCGLRFQIPDRLFIPHLGIIWSKLKKEYPIVQHAAPIAGSKGELTIDTATGLPIPRVWFISESGEELIQFQIDRFYFNWRRKKSEYPGFSRVIKKFVSLQQIVKDTFKEFKFGDLIPLDYELSYINHIIKGEGWESTEDIANLYLDYDWKPSESRFLKKPIRISWKKEFELPEKMGILTADLKQGIRTEDKTQLYLFEMRAKGFDTSAKEVSLKWYDLAHEWIVRGFTDLTTPEAHQLWQREK